MCTCHFIHLHLHGNRLTVNQGYTNPTVGYFFNISKCKYWYIKLLVGYQYPRSGSWLIGIRYLNIVTFRQYLKFRNSVSNRSFWPCLNVIKCIKSCKEVKTRISAPALETREMIMSRDSFNNLVTFITLETTPANYFGLNYILRNNK